MVHKKIDDTQAQELYLQGLSLKEVADHFDVSISTVSTALRRTGTPTRGRSQVRTSRGLIRRDAIDKVVSEMYTNGASPKQIREELGIAEGQVSDALRRTKMVRRVSDADIAQAYLDGKEIGDIAEQFGLSEDAVGRSLGRARVHLRGQPIDPDDVALMHLQGYTNTAIADRLDVSEATVSRALKKSGANA